MAAISGEINGQPTARAFVEDVLSKYLKIVKICDNNQAAECNFPTKIQPAKSSESKLTSNNLKSWDSLRYVKGSFLPDNNLSVYIVTNDGLSAKLFYNPNCVSKVQSAVVGMACLNIIYDANGAKGPNHVGEDIGFVTTFLSGINSVSVAPGIGTYSAPESLTHSGATRHCEQKGSKGKKYSLPNMEEMQAIHLNRNLTFSSGVGAMYWTTVRYIANNQSWAWTIYVTSDTSITRFGRYDYLKAYTYCVLR